MAKSCVKRYFEQASIVSNEYAGAGAYCITIKAPHLKHCPTNRAKAEKMSADTVFPRAGQFYMFGLKDSSHILPRPLSLYSFDESKNELSFLYRPSGTGTRELSIYRSGETLHIHGPLGCGFGIPKEGSRFIIAGGGIGLAPLNQLVKEILNANPHARILFVAGGKNSEIESLIDFFRLPERVETVLCTDDGSAGKKGFVPGILADSIAQIKRKKEHIAVLYACGPNIMLEKIAVLAETCTIPCQISLERRMACGAAACMGCSIKTRKGMKKICADGPVFDTQLFSGMEHIG